MGINYNAFKKGNFSAAEIAEELVGEREVGQEDFGPVVQYANGGNGLGWCTGFVTKAMIDGNQGQWLEGVNRLSAPAVMQHGEKLGLTSNLSEYLPNVGSILSKSDAKGVHHTAMVTHVDRDATGEPISFTVVHGNYNDMVYAEVLTPDELRKEFDNKYIDSRKIDQYHQVHYPTARLFIQPQTTETQSAEPAPAIPVTSELSKLRDQLQQSGVTESSRPAEPLLLDLATPLFPDNPRNAPSTRRL